MSHDRVGDVLHDQGDLAGALAAYGESLALRRRLAEANPSKRGLAAGPLVQSRTTWL